MAEVSLSPEAEAEYAAARAYYRARSRPAAAGFEAAVAHALETLETFPGIGTPVAGGHRRQPLRRYPYGLVYRITDDGEVRVVGVSHDRQLPADWAARDQP